MTNRLARRCEFTTVGDSATSGALLAENLNRLGATFINTSAAVLYIRLDGGTATATTGHNVQLAQNEEYQLPFNYTGAVTGIWATAPGGACNVAEFT